MTTDKIALVLGAGGGIGSETAAALARRGWRIRALARNAGRAAAHPDWDWLHGDALDGPAVARAAAGASLIVHAVNPPGYRDWDRLVLPMLENTVAAARESGARILLPGTVYNYGPDAFPLLREESPQRPETSKGAIRVAMERRLAEAAQAGVRSLVLRAGDYFGPRAGSSWFSQGLVRPGRPVRSVTYPGSPGVGHSWAYLPDVAETFARLVEREAELEPFARFHFGGYWDADGTGLIAAIGRAAGRPVRVRRLPWALLRLGAPFNQTLSGLVEMRPLWQTPVRLDNTRLAAFLGAEPRTPLDEAVRATLAGLGALG